MCWQARSGCSCQRSQCKCKQSGRLLHCSVQPGTKRDLWAKDPFSSIENHFKGSAYSRGPPWQPLLMGGMVMHLSGPIRIGGCVSGKTGEMKPGGLVYSGALVLKYCPSKDLLLPQSRRRNSCVHAVFGRKGEERTFWPNLSPCAVC